MSALKRWPSVLFLSLLFLYLYRSHYQLIGNTKMKESMSNCSDHSNTAKIGDYLSYSLLDLEVSSFLYWSCLVLASFYCCYVLHKVCFDCPDYVFKPSERDVGYLVTPGKTKRDIANMVRKRRQIGDIPPPYPNGWYEVMRSCDLTTGTSKAVYMNGLHLAVFRSQSGHVSVIDAYCPHLGANLGVGGSVIGNCIKCPFHGWEFDGETGQCVKVPYSTGKAPSFAKVKVWPSTEVNGLIMLWYDAEGRDPSYTIPEVPQIKSGRWANRGRTVQYMSCHLEEVNENGADMSHLNAVHETGVQNGYGVNYRLSSWLGKLLSHEWSGKWEALPAPNEHIGHMTLKHSMKLFGRWSLKPCEVTMNIEQVGPGVVLLYVSNPLWSGMYYQTLVPEEPLKQRLTTYFYCDWWLPGLFGHFILTTYSIQVERDALIWDNKTYIKKPILVKEDHLIQAHRRWFGQFYSQNSIKMSAAMKGEGSQAPDLSW